MAAARRVFRLRNFVVLLILSGLGVGAWLTFGAGAAPVVAGTTPHTITAGVIEDTLLVTGLVKPAVTIDLRSEASGMVESVAVREGDRVSAGQELLRLDSRVAMTAVQEAEANLKQAEMQQAAAEIDLDEDTLALRRKTFERAKELLENGLIARSEYETRELEVKAAERSLERARRNMDTNRARIDQLRAAVDRARAQLQHTIIRSPMDAWIIRRHVEVGSGVAGVAQSSTGGTIVITLGDAQEASLEAKVTATDARRLRAGLPTRLRLDSEPDLVRKGHVLSVATAGEQDASTRLTTFPVLISVDVEGSASWINVPAQAEIVIATRNDALVVPDGCIRTDPSGASMIMLRSEGGEDRPQTVTVGAVREDQVELTAGASAGQVITCR
jgi:multidrug efflux pump subunit AcrA (membrane-fusion protein)